MDFILESYPTQVSHRIPFSNNVPHGSPSTILLSLVGSKPGNLEATIEWYEKTPTRLPEALMAMFQVNPDDVVASLSHQLDIDHRSIAAEHAI